MTDIKRCHVEFASLLASDKLSRLKCSRRRLDQISDSQRLSLSRYAIFKYIRRSPATRPRPFYLPQRSTRPAFSAPFRTTNTPTMPPGSTEQREKTVEEARILTERELVWSDLPLTTSKGTIPFLEVREGELGLCHDQQRGTPALGEVLLGHAVSCI